jgi:crotonobetainyl-CoA:carnitine CoA-transferase CaiB-like acyl-CoA transferase
MPHTATHWQALFHTAGREDWAIEPALGDGAARAAMIGTLYECLAECLLRRSSAEWLAILDRVDVPCSAINTLDDLVDAPHLKATGFFKTIEHPEEGRLVMTKPPIRFGATPCAITKSAPGLG